MADNVAITPGVGASVAADDIGGILYQRIKIAQGADGAGVDVSPAAPLFVKPAPRLIVAVGTTLTRPANQTPYTGGDAISNSATAGSVTAQPVTVSDTNDLPVEVKSIEVVTTDTGVDGKDVSVWVYNSDPTASSGVVGGDNAAFSNKKAGYVGTLTGTFKLFSDGAAAICIPNEGDGIITLPGSGAKTLWLQYQTLDDFTPSANSTTFIPTVRAIQGAA